MAGQAARPFRGSRRSLGAVSFHGLICPATSMRLAPNAEGFNPQKTHRWPQLLSTFRANTCCPTRAAAWIICSVCFSDQTPSPARWAICSLKGQFQSGGLEFVLAEKGELAAVFKAEEIGQAIFAYAFGAGRTQQDPVDMSEMCGSSRSMAPARTSHLPPCERGPSRLAILAKTLENCLENRPASAGTGSRARCAAEPP